jgi:DNA invertase Pin-like site-specific DNA recombinase
MTATATPRLYGYVRASTDGQVASPETQRQIISEYATKKLGKEVDGFFVDPASSGKKRLYERAAGRELMLRVEPGDTVIVARLDRLSRSFIAFAEILDQWTNKKVKIHLCDMPGGHFDPDNPMSEMMIGILIVFANYERKLIVQRTREGLNARKIRGEKYCRWPPYGFKWERRYDQRLGKHVEVKVVDEYEVAIMRKCVSLKAAGYSLDQIHQYLSYEWRVKNRVGGTWTKSRVQAVIACGIQLLAEQERDQRLSAKTGTGSLNDFEPENEYDD